jgi:hypothetical protein
MIKRFNQFINEGSKPTPLSGELLKQYNWLVSYMKSPKYLERLKKEFPSYDKKQLTKERDTRLKNVMSLKDKVHIEGEDKLGGSAGFYIPKTSYGEQLVWGKWEKQDSTNNKKGNLFLRTEYNPNKYKPDEGYEFIPTHEFSHAADDAGIRIPKSTQDKIYQLTKPGKYSKQDTFGHWREKEGTHEFDYEQTPTEFIARMQAVRALLDRLKLYDATKDFTLQDWDKIITNPKVKQDTAFQDIIKCLKGDNSKGVNCPIKKKNFIELFNSIAQIDNTELQNIYNSTG